MDTPQTAVIRMVSTHCMTYAAIVRELQSREGIVVSNDTVIRAGRGSNEPSYRVGAALIRIANQIDAERELRIISDET